MDELNRKKLENSQNMQFAREYLSKTKFSQRIATHPRFDSILWKISSLMRKAGVKAFSEQGLSFLKSILVVAKDGSLVMLENKDRNDFVTSIKYYFDENDMTLKRIVCDKNHDDSETTTISTYDDDGIEVSSMLEQRMVDGSKFYSNSTRVPSRINMINIQRISERNGERYVLADVMQIRSMAVAYEDLEPTADEIDPLDVVHLFAFGVPPLYRDLDKEELAIIKECDGEVFPLDEEHNVELLMDYIERNKFYGRSRKFEGALARYLDIEDRIQDGEQL